MWYLCYWLYRRKIFFKLYPLSRATAVEHDDAMLPRRRIGAPAAAGHDAAAEQRRAAPGVRCAGSLLSRTGTPVRGPTDTRVPQEQTISVRWILSILRAIPLTPCWVRARRGRSQRAMREHLRRYTRTDSRIGGDEKCAWYRCCQDRDGAL